MMKRGILVATIPALLVVGTINAAEIYNKDGNRVDLYGKAVGLYYPSKGNGENGYSNDGDMIYACLGFRGETQIDSDPTGYDQWEYNFQGNNSEGIDAQTGNKTCLIFAGLKYAGVGSFDCGRNYGMVYDALGYTDTLPKFGNDTAYNDDLFVGRIGDVATYHNSNFFSLVDGLSFAVQRLGKNERDTARHSSDGDVDGSISHEYEGFGIAGAYGATNRTDLQKESSLDKGERAERWATGLRYDANNIYLVASYGEARNAMPIINKFANTSGSVNRTQDVLLVARYQFGFSLRPSIAYTESKAKDVEGIDDVDLMNYFEVGVTCYFNKSMSTYVDYIINQIDSDNKLGISSDDTAAVGIVYQL